MMNEINVVLLVIVVSVLCAGALKFIEWFDRKDKEGWNG